MSLISPNLALLPALVASSFIVAVEGIAVAGMAADEVADTAVGMEAGRVVAEVVLAGTAFAMGDLALLAGDRRFADRIGVFAAGVRHRTYLDLLADIDRQSGRHPILNDIVSYIKKQKGVG